MNEEGLNPIRTTETGEELGRRLDMASVSPDLLAKSDGKAIHRRRYTLDLIAQDCTCWRRACRHPNRK